MSHQSVYYWNVIRHIFFPHAWFHNNFLWVNNKFTIHKLQITSIERRVIFVYLHNEQNNTNKTV